MTSSWVDLRQWYDWPSTSKATLNDIGILRIVHDDVIKWKHFPCYWPFVRGIHRSPVNSPVNSPHKGQWRGDLMFSLICVWTNDWVNNRGAGDLRRYRSHYDVTVMNPQRVDITTKQNTTHCISCELHNKFPLAYQNDPFIVIDFVIKIHAWSRDTSIQQSDVTFQSDKQDTYQVLFWESNIEW